MMIKCVFHPILLLALVGVLIEESHGRNEEAPSSSENRTALGLTLEDCVGRVFWNNVSLQKTEAAGPGFQTRPVRLYNDSFPQGGASTGLYQGPAEAAVRERESHTATDPLLELDGAPPVAQGRIDVAQEELDLHAHGVGRGHEEQRVRSLGGRDAAFEGVPGFPGSTAPGQCDPPHRQERRVVGGHAQTLVGDREHLLHGALRAERLRQGGAGHALEGGDARRVGHLDGSAGETFGLSEAPLKAGAPGGETEEGDADAHLVAARSQYLALGEQRIELLLRHPHA